MDSMPPRVHKTRTILYNVLKNLKEIACFSRVWALTIANGWNKMEVLDDLSPESAGGQDETTDAQNHRQHYRNRDPRHNIP
jgi:hypothetical protein